MDEYLGKYPDTEIPENLYQMMNIYQQEKTKIASNGDVEIKVKQMCYDMLLNILDKQKQQQLIKSFRKEVEADTKKV